MRNNKIIIGSVLSVSLLVVVYGVSTNYSNKIQNQDYKIDQSDMLNMYPMKEKNGTENLSESEKKWLIHMREEEKLARDVYQTLGQKWGIQIFTNIAASEQTHTNAVKSLIYSYGLIDPVKDDSVGVFTSPELQKLYADLIEKGYRSSLDALIVGATIEDLDINDLKTAMQETKMTDIIEVYQNLQRGSRNHLRAFSRQITSRGGSYSPEYISQIDYDNIINSQQERGR
jgi:hypothetical protein